MPFYQTVIRNYNYIFHDALFQSWYIIFVTNLDWKFLGELTNYPRLTVNCLTSVSFPFNSNQLCLVEKLWNDDSLSVFCDTRLVIPQRINEPAKYNLLHFIGHLHELKQRVKGLASLHIDVAKGGMSRDIYPKQENSICIT